MRKQGTPELNAWVVVRPDDTVVVRFARSEMGQGALTGLCQLVAEELECDWSKVTWEYVDPRENIRAQAHLRQLQLDRQQRDPPVARLCAAAAARRRGRC